MLTRQAGDVVLQVPLNVMMTSKGAEESHMGVWAKTDQVCPWCAGSSDDAGACAHAQRHARPVSCPRTSRSVSQPLTALTEQSFFLGGIHQNIAILIQPAGLLAAR